MKTTFIFPPIPYKFAKTPYPPLGIGYLATILRMHDIEVDFIDGQILEENQFWSDINKLTTDIILISATIRQIKGAMRVAEITKKRNPQTTVVLGGPGPSALAMQQQDFGKNTAIDIIVQGEAEESLPLLLRQINEDRSIDNIPNLLINRNGNIVRTIKNPIRSEITKIPWPDRTIFNEKAYISRWQESAKMTSIHIIGSRGCPFNCSFCDHTITGRKVRYRNPEDVIAEMLFLEQRYSPDDIFYFDDLFTVNKKRVVTFCRLLQKYSLKTSWSAQGRVDSVDEEMLEAMKLAGCTELMFGVESGSDKILEYLVKGFTREKIIHTFDICHQLKMKAGAYLIIGVPGETRRDILDTISLVERIEPTLLNYSFLTPFPNTPLYTATQQWIGEWDYEKWDDFDATVYNCKFEIDPRKARDMIHEVYLKKIASGMPYNEYQFANRVQ